MFFYESLCIDGYEYPYSEEDIESFFLTCYQQGLFSIVYIANRFSSNKFLEWKTKSNKYGIDFYLAKEIKIPCLEDKSLVFIPENQHDEEEFKKTFPIIQNITDKRLSKEWDNRLFIKDGESLYDLSGIITSRISTLPLPDYKITEMVDSPSDIQNHFSLNTSNDENKTLNFKQQYIPYKEFACLDENVFFPKICWESIPNYKANELKDEILTLKNNNNLILFDIIHALSRQIDGFTCGGLFNKFALSIAMRLPLNEEINEEHSYVITTTHKTKNILTAEINKVLSTSGYCLKHPIEFEHETFINFIRNYRNNYSSNSIIDFSSLRRLKKRFECKLNRKEFYNEMRLYFLMNPEEEYVFKKSLMMFNLKFGKWKLNYSKNYIVPVNFPEIYGESVNLHTVSKHLFPYLSWNIIKTN